MNYSQILRCDPANGPGMRVSLFVSGCRRHCPGCFNKGAWDFCAGKPFTKEVEQHILELLENPYTQGLTVLGGEPMEPENVSALLPFLIRVRRSLRDKPGKDIWLYSGYLFEDLLQERKNKLLLKAVDVLVDGPYIASQKDARLSFRGSRNQRILSMPASLEAKTPVWKTEYNT